jgi:hypothetical protein
VACRTRESGAIRTGGRAEPGVSCSGETGWEFPRRHCVQGDRLWRLGADRKPTGAYGSTHTSDNYSLMLRVWTQAAIIWLAPRFCEEHREALDWLNSITGDRHIFFGVRLEAFSISGSPPAPKFTLVAKPNRVESKREANPKSSRACPIRIRTTTPRILGEITTGCPVCSVSASGFRNPPT